MITLEQAQASPLKLADDGTIRIAESRVSLDSVIHHYKLGASAEQIAQKFPALDLADVYAAITYYLSNEKTVDEYLHQQETKGDSLQAELESNPHFQKNTAELRARLLARKSEPKEA